MGAEAASMEMAWGARNASLSLRRKLVPVLPTPTLLGVVWRSSQARRCVCFFVWVNQRESDPFDPLHPWATISDGGVVTRPTCCGGHVVSRNTHRTHTRRASRMLVATALALEAGQAMLDAKDLCAKEGQEGRSGEGGGVSYKGRHDL